MLPYEFIVTGPPISHQTRNLKRLREWQGLVRTAAAEHWPLTIKPLSENLQITVVYYHDGVTANIDNDNMVKPIQDALHGLIYVDDGQITDTHIRKSNLNGSYQVRGMSSVVAQGFSQGDEFIYVKVDYAPDHEVLLT